MRILSQDGMADLPYESIGICINYHNKTDIIAYPAGTYSQDDEYWTLAKYSTEAKARKAMEMLREEYTFEKQFETICSGTTDYPSKPTYYFQFPQDSEVEV